MQRTRIIDAPTSGTRGCYKPLVAELRIKPPLAVGQLQAALAGLFPGYAARQADELGLVVMNFGPPDKLLNDLRDRGGACGLHQLPVLVDSLGQMLVQWGRTNWRWPTALAGTQLRRLKTPDGPMAVLRLAPSAELAEVRGRLWRDVLGLLRCHGALSPSEFATTSATLGPSAPQHYKPLVVLGQLPGAHRLRTSCELPVKLGSLRFRGALVP